MLFAEITGSISIVPSPWMITVALWTVLVCWVLFEVLTKVKGNVPAQAMWCGALLFIPIVPPLAWFAWGRKQYAQPKAQAD